MEMSNGFVEAIIEVAMKMLEAGEPQHKILTKLVEAAEKIAGQGAVSSILVLDKDGLLRNAASPQLPNDYLAAIDGLRPDARVGTCAAAAATGKMVVTTDFTADDKWAELRHLPIAMGFAGAWSLPIKNTDDKVIGTFGTYFRQTRQPSAAEIKAKQLLVRVAAIVLH